MTQAFPGRPWHGRPVLAAATLLALLAAAGCGGSATSGHAGTPTQSSAQPASSAAPSSPASPSPASSTAPSPPQPQHVSLRFDWLIGGQHIGFVAAQAQGFYRKAGLDVALYQGKGSGLTVQSVGAGKNTFGIAAADTVIKGITKGVPIKAIGVVLQDSPSTFFYHKGLHFNTPRDLRGKTIISSAGNANLELLPAVLSRYGMALKDVHLELVRPSSFVALELKNPKDVELGYIMNELPPFRSVDPSMQAKLYSSFGVNPLNASIITSTAEIKSHPAVVRAFMRASAQGWAWAEAHPKQAVAEAVKMFPHGASSGHAKILLQSFKLARTLLHTPATKGKPLFWNREGRLGKDGRAGQAV